MKSFTYWLFLALVPAALAFGTSTALAEKIDGQIKKVTVDKFELTLKDKTDKDWTFQVLPNAVIELNKKPAMLKDLKEGDSAQITYEKKGDKNQATLIQAERGSKGLLQRILRGDKKILKGKLKSLTVEKMQFVVTDNEGKDHTLRLGVNAMIHLDRMPGKFQDLLNADIVEVRYQQEGDNFIVTEVHATRKKDAPDEKK